MGDIRNSDSRGWNVYVLALAKAVGIIAYFALIYMLVAWVSLSIAISDTGPIHWAEGWKRLWHYQ